MATTKAKQERRYFINLDGSRFIVFASSAIEAIKQLCEEEPDLINSSYVDINITVMEIEDENGNGVISLDDLP